MVRITVEMTEAEAVKLAEALDAHQDDGPCGLGYKSAEFSEVAYRIITAIEEQGVEW